MTTAPFTPTWEGFDRLAEVTLLDEPFTSITIDRYEHGGLECHRGGPVIKRPAPFKEFVEAAKRCEYEMDPELRKEVEINAVLESLESRV